MIVAQVTEGATKKLKRPYYPVPGQINYEDHSLLIQTDWDYPGVARTFGWAGEDDQISAAFDFLSDNIGATADDPGYFAS